MRKLTKGELWFQRFWKITIPAILLLAFFSCKTEMATIKKDGNAYSLDTVKDKITNANFLYYDKIKVPHSVYIYRGKYFYYDNGSMIFFKNKN